MYSPKTYWAVFGLSLTIYLAMVLWTLPAISAAACGLRPFDLRPFGHTPDEARLFLDCLTVSGRELYLGPQKWLDLVYPLTLALVLAGAARALIVSGPIRIAVLLAVCVGMLADYAENLLVARLLTATGPVADDAVIAASRATVVKSVLTGLAMVVVCVALARRVFAGWSRK